MEEIIALYRPKDHIFFTIPLVILGFAFAARLEALKPALMPLLIILVANIVGMSFAFAINEVEDADDDKKDKGRSNPVARGALSKPIALFFTFLAFGLSGYLFYKTNLFSLYTGVAMLALSFLYSYKGVRLKSMPIVDLVSHGLMLSGLIFLSSFLALSKNFTPAIPLFLGVTLISIYGQFYNQLRDIKEDKAAHITNTTSFIGKGGAKLVMFTVLIIGAMLISYSFYNGSLPLLPLGITLFLIPVAFIFKKYASSRDLRANIATTSLHSPFLILFNIFAVLFLIYIFI
jgi:4-hydroxybenzoate polyprenyltransferase